VKEYAYAIDPTFAPALTFGQVPNKPFVLHLRIRSATTRAKALCSVPVGAALPDQLQRARLNETCPECAARFAMAVRKDQGKPIKVPKPPRPRSPLEQDLEGRLIAGGYRGFVTEFRPIEGRGWRLDFAWPPERVGIEVDGGAFVPGGGAHSRGTGFEDDCVKRAALVCNGWRVISVTGRLIRKGYAERWLSMLLDPLGFLPREGPPFPTPRELRPLAVRAAK